MLVDEINQRADNYMSRTEELFRNASDKVEASIKKQCFKHLNFKNIATTTYSFVEACRIVPAEQTESYVNQIKMQIKEMDAPIDKIEETASMCGSEKECHKNNYKEALKYSKIISDDVSTNIEKAVYFSVAKLKLLVTCAIYEVKRLYWKTKQKEKITDKCVNAKLKEKINLFEL